MMFTYNYCTDFMFQEVMVCVTCSPLILSLIICTKHLNLRAAAKESQKTLNKC